jgi:hydrogenase expression/formation protein HypE
MVVSYLKNEILSELHDSAFLQMGGKIGFTTDSFVVEPIFFPGGDIGKLAVAGTFNDLVVSGIEPKYLSLSFIIEEGFPMEDMNAEKELEARYYQTANQSFNKSQWKRRN